MTVSELGERMDASELMEWVAYYNTQDEESIAKIQAQIDEEASENEKLDKLRNFLSTGIGKK